MRSEWKLTLAAALGWLGTPAWAQQPLEAFVRAASERATDVQIAQVDTRSARADRLGSVGGLLPQLSMTGGYTRNQQAVEASFPVEDGSLQTATIQAKDQLDATARVELALVDLPAWSHYLASDRRVLAAEAQQIAVRTQVVGAVVESWFRHASARRVEAATQTAQRTAEEVLAAVESREQAGLATVLDVERSRADVARAQQRAAEAELEVALSRRQLEVLSGLTPAGEDAEVPDPRGEDGPLESWIARIDQVPAVRAAEATVRAARSDTVSASTQLLPAVSAFATERWTNAAGFGPDFLWSAGVQARWNLDLVRPAELEARSAARARADLVARQARETAATTLHDSWVRVRSLSVRVQAARRAEEASTRAATIARARYDAGTGSALELSQAERDRFDAEVERIRADADLHVARRSLRLAAGLPPDPTLSAGGTP